MIDYTPFLIMLIGLGLAAVLLLCLILATTTWMVKALDFHRADLRQLLKLRVANPKDEGEWWKRSSQ